jgi:sugar phosphate isomerase/epimerase
MTRLVFHAGSCWPVPLDETMRQAAAVGYAGIELAPHPLFLPPAHWSPENAGWLRDAATDAGLVIASLDLGHAEPLGAIPFEPSLMAPYGQQRDRRIRLLRQAIAFASELDCPLVTFPSGPVSPLMPRSCAMELLIEGLEAVLRWAADRAVGIALEPRPGHLIGCYADYTELRQVFAGSNFGLCYDLAHGEAVFENGTAVIGHASDLRHLRLPSAGGVAYRSAVEALGSSAYASAICLTSSDDASPDGPHSLAALASLTDLGSSSGARPSSNCHNGRSPQPAHAADAGRPAW